MRVDLAKGLYQSPIWVMRSLTEPQGGSGVRLHRRGGARYSGDLRNGHLGLQPPVSDALTGFYFMQAQKLTLELDQWHLGMVGNGSKDP